jgi:L-ribulose-5-phosphate 4-epimerase
MTGPYAELRQLVAEANHEIDSAGLVVQAFGNASQVERESGVFAIKPSGIACREVTADDVVVVSLETGDVVWGENRPSSDTPTHRAIYEGLDSPTGIAHTHSRFATAWAQAREPIPCLGTTHADHFRGQVPITRTLSPDEIQGDYEVNTGRVIVEIFGPERFDPEETPGALVASHGPFVWGETAHDAVDMAAAVELMAELATRTLTIRPDRTEIEEELRDRHFTRKHGPLAYYGQP